MDKYQTFISGFKEGRLKDQQNAINFLFDKILPGIKDILSSYEDDQDQTLVAKVIVCEKNRVYIFTREMKLDHEVDEIYVRIECEYREPLKNIWEILSRIESEFGEYLGMYDNVRKVLRDGNRTGLDFYLIRSPFKYK